MSEGVCVLLAPCLSLHNLSWRTLKTVSPSLPGLMRGLEEEIFHSHGLSIFSSPKLQEPPLPPNPPLRYLSDHFTGLL